MKKFAFVNDAAEREYKAFPKDVQQSFGTSLRAVQDNNLYYCWCFLNHNRGFFKITESKLCSKSKLVQHGKKYI
jgi:hypothetical protein